MNKGGFSWNRLLGITALKSKISRTIGVPFTRSGRQSKLGATIGCITMLAAIVIVMAATMALAMMQR